MGRKKIQETKRRERKLNPDKKNQKNQRIKQKKKAEKGEEKTHQRKKDKGGGEPYTSRRPFQPFSFLFFSGLNLFPIRHFSFFNPNPQEFQLLIEKEHITQENIIVYNHLILAKKEAWCFTFSFLLSCPSDQAQQLLSVAAAELVAPGHSSSRVSSS
jgi:hypothetical protein